MENKKQIKKAYDEPKFIVSKFCADVILASGGGDDAYKSYNMDWYLDRFVEE